MVRAKSLDVTYDLLLDTDRPRYVADTANPNEWENALVAIIGLHIKLPHINVLATRASDRDKTESNRRTRSLIIDFVVHENRIISVPRYLVPTLGLYR